MITAVLFSTLVSWENTFAADFSQWKCLAYCLSQLAFTEKGMKKLIESFKTYEHALCDDAVMDHFRNIINKVPSNAPYLCARLAV